MKNKNIVLAVALIGFITSVQAVPKDNTWYSGGKLGLSQYRDTSLYGNGINNRINSDSTRKDQLGAGAFFGYQANKHLSFELGYDWLGRMAYKGNIKNNALKAQGMSLATRLSYPLKDNLDIYTRIGGMVWHVDPKGTYASGDLVRVSSQDTGVSPLVSIGMEYSWNKNWGTRLDYQWTNNIGDSSIIGMHPDNFILGVGISYHYGQDKVATKNPVVKKRLLDLKSDVLFNFDKTTLKSKGQKALDEFCSKLSLTDLKDGSVIILGYTDRIGSEAYNQELSQARAQSVVSYLVSKGIPYEKISARGMGKSNPITKDFCNEVKGSAAIISCLSPDRRVEIEVRGDK